MSDINQLRYELQAFVARYPDFQIDLSQIKVVQSVSLMQPQFQQVPPAPFYSQPQQYQVPPQAQSPVPIVPLQAAPRQPTPQAMTKIFAQQEGVEIVPPRVGLPPVADAGLQDAAQAAVQKSLSRKPKAAN